MITGRKLWLVVGAISSEGFLITCLLLDIGCRHEVYCTRDLSAAKWPRDAPYYLKIWSSF